MRSALPALPALPVRSVLPVPPVRRGQLMRLMRALRLMWDAVRSGRGGPVGGRAGVNGGAPGPRRGSRGALGMRPGFGQPVICLRSLSPPLIRMRRGLACSATGMRRVRTPASYEASMRSVSRVSPRNS